MSSSQSDSPPNAGDLAPVSGTPDDFTTIQSSERIISVHTDFVPEFDNPWFPYTLRPFYLRGLTALALSLCVLLIIIARYSHNNHGLVAEESAFRGARFVPTLLVVLYTQLTVMLFEDVRRTESFARLAKAGKTGLPAETTLLNAPRIWWKTLAHGMSAKKSGGQRAWSLVISCLVNLCAFLLMSPLSSLLLDVQEVQLPATVMFSRASLRQDTRLQTNRETFSRTTNSLLQGSETSPWLFDDFIVLPFWPADVQNSTWNYDDVMVPQEWTANTTVLRSEVVFVKLDTVSDRAQNSFRVGNETASSVLFRTSTGCEYRLWADSTNNYIVSGFVFWTDIKHLVHEGEKYDIRKWTGGEIDAFGFNSSSECGGDQIIIMSSPWRNSDHIKENFQPITAVAYLGSSSLSVANMPVTASFSELGMKVTLDENLFHVNSEIMDPGILNASQLLETQTMPDWFRYLPSELRAASPIPKFPGVGSLLASQYSFSLHSMFQDEDLPKKAANTTHRFLGEVFRTTLDDFSMRDETHVSGSITRLEKRLLVRSEVAISIAAILAISFVGLFTSCIISGPRKRPLNLKYDPGSILGLASLVTSRQAGIFSAQGLSQQDREMPRELLGRRHYRTMPGVLMEIDSILGRSEYISPSPPNEPLACTRRERNRALNSTEATPKPTIIRLRTILSFACCLLVLIVAMGVLYSFANARKLHSNVFVRQNSFSVYGFHGSFNAFALFPTIFAVGIGLWWNALDFTFRSLQPLVSILKTPKIMRFGAGISYNSSYWIWAAYKSARNRHWLLCFVTFGSMLAQIFVISMAALFETHTGTISNTTTINVDLEIRQIPHLRLVSALYPPSLETKYLYTWQPQYVATALSDLYTNLTTNWIYSAVIHSAYHGNEPPWSRNGWSFVPTNLSQFLNDPKNGFSREIKDTALHSPMNITLETPAIRARIECSPIEQVKNESSWIVNPHVFHDVTLHSLLFQNSTYSTPLLSSARNLSCCINGTFEDNTMTSSVAVAYWSLNVGTNLQTLNSPTAYTGNFTTKWLRGQATTYRQYDNSTIIRFREIPRLQALNCMPIIETAWSKVKVSQKSGQVFEFDILSEPETTGEAWMDSFVIHNLSDSSVAEDIYVPDDAMEMYGPLMGLNQNMTTSYGVLFLHSLLQAADLGLLAGPPMSNGDTTTENLNDMVFNVRDNRTGINMDFMSYASYLQVGKNPETLLDETALLEQTQKTFSLFFQHFASSGVSLETGGWVYQPIGTNLDSLPPPAPGFEPKDGKNRTYRRLNTNRTTEVTVTTDVELLRMNKVATWISLSILVWLTVTTILIAALQRRYFGSVRKMETVADGLMLVAGSTKLLELVREYGVEQLKNAEVYTKLGWFASEDGGLRWAVDVVENDELEETDG